MAIQFLESANPPANYVTIPIGSHLQPAIVSVMIWVKLVTSPSPNWAYIMSCGDSYLLVYYFSSTNASYFFFRNGGSYYSINDATALTIGEWTHIAGVYSPGVTWLMYRNGNQSATGSSSTAMTYDSRPLTIGAGGVGTEGRNMLAHHADFRVYNRVVTANEMSTIYACRGHDGIRNGLVGRWLLDEGYEGYDVGSSAGIIKDCSDYKINGDTVRSGSTGPAYSGEPGTRRRKYL